MKSANGIAQKVSEEAARVGTKVSAPSLGHAEKHARLFLKHLPPTRDTVADRLQTFQAFHPDAGYEENPHFAAMVDFDLAARAIAALLERYGAEKPRTNTWHDLAHWIALRGTQAWDRPVGKAMDVNPDAPLCVFVCGVLAAAGIKQSVNAVSEALVIPRACGDGQAPTIPYAEARTDAARRAIDQLAARLHWKLEHLDPTGASDWSDLSDHQRDIFRIAVASLLDECQLVDTAMGR
jgi:hypothetical protein